LRAWELAIVGVVHLLGLTLAALIMAAVGKGDPGLALVLAAIVGSQTAALLYHRREPDPAPFGVKAEAGALMAVLAAAASLVAQARWAWMTYPEIVITIGATGSFIFPFVLFGSMRKALARGKKTR
jgi:hypothetical protein